MSSTVARTAAYQANPTQSGNLRDDGTFTAAGKGQMCVPTKEKNAQFRKLKNIREKYVRPRPFLIIPYNFYFNIFKGISFSLGSPAHYVSASIP